MADMTPKNTSCLHLFLDAGVMHLLTADVPQRGPAAPAFLFAAADLEAHGLLATARKAGAALVDDADVCGLLTEHAHCLTWT